MQFAALFFLLQYNQILLNMETTYSVATACLANGTCLHLDPGEHTWGRRARGWGGWGWHSAGGLALGKGFR